MDCSLTGSSVHGIFQTRVLEWGAIAFSEIYIYIYTHIYVCVCVCIHIYMCVCICMYVYIYTHIPKYSPFPFEPDMIFVKEQYKSEWGKTPMIFIKEWYKLEWAKLLSFFQFKKTSPIFSVSRKTKILSYNWEILQEGQCKEKLCFSGIKLRFWETMKLVFVHNKNYKIYAF